MIVDDPSFNLDDWKMTVNDRSTIEEMTRGQAQSSLWYEQREGRITASKVHSIHTKTESIKKNKPFVKTSPLVADVLDDNYVDLDGIPAIKHGREFENSARKAFAAHFGSNHEDGKLNQCGLVVS